ncbi:MAG TPA: M1 family metallopeptidase [Longimicrobiaceae bacterium]|nr:M1 family metallopeptidase [Longimicrobiaceae bacterium]
MRSILLTASLLVVSAAAAAAQDAPRFTRADTLRGSIGPARAWWDATFYDLDVRVSPADSSVRGRVGIAYRVLRPGREMQIDLQEPLVVDSVVQDGRRLEYRREGNAFFVAPASPQRAGETRTVTVHYHGKPRAAENAPWDGGFVWARDTAGNPWIATAVQGLGASAWWPNKDHQSEEPDSQRIAVTVPDPLVNVSNGRLRSTTRNPDGTTTYEWFVRNPINNYDVAVNAGAYAHFEDAYQGERGTLTLDYWPLAENLEKAKVQFQQVKPMLQCFEHWFGPFPWYEDGFKLVETPHLGMEHQSAIAYGNKYQNGYLGKDRSGTGHGMQWDFIIIHEAGHEWWGNHVTARDIADMWVHESFTNYSEALFTECQQGKEAGFAYARGGRRNVQNDRPIVGVYGVHNEGSGDMYDKGGLMLHTIRQVIGDDEKWRSILRGLNEEFGRKTVTGRQVQEYVSRRAGIDLEPVFRQYLTTTMVPVLEYRVQGSTLSYRWANVVPGFDMPVKAMLSGDGFSVIRPTTRWKTARVSLPDPAAFRVDPNYYVDVRQVGSGR